MTTSLDRSTAAAPAGARSQHMGRCEFCEHEQSVRSIRHNGYKARQEYKRTKQILLYWNSTHQKMDG